MHFSLMLHFSQFIFIFLYQHDRAYRIAMAAVKAWSEKWYFAEAVNILCQESHEHTTLTVTKFKHWQLQSLSIKLYYVVHT